MTKLSPITPPPELRRQWLDNDDFPFVAGTHDLLSITRDRLNSVIDQCAAWAERRPDPPSDKELAMRILVENGTNLDGRMELDSDDIAILTRVVRSIND